MAGLCTRAVLAGPLGLAVPRGGPGLTQMHSVGARAQAALRSFAQVRLLGRKQVPGGSQPLLAKSSHPRMLRDLPSPTDLHGSGGRPRCSHLGTVGHLVRVGIIGTARQWFLPQATESHEPT